MIPLKIVKSIVRQTASALAHLHSRGCPLELNLLNLLIKHTLVFIIYELLILQIRY